MRLGGPNQADEQAQLDTRCYARKRKRRRVQTNQPYRDKDHEDVERSLRPSKTRLANHLYHDDSHDQTEVFNLHEIKNKVDNYFVDRQSMNGAHPVMDDCAHKQHLLPGIQDECSLMCAADLFPNN
ncbi:hypothetical protein Tcan_16139 [Toxocara canis]|uniref:Uncharacterized protein n=1 Tax=Toxocara canis TaxID=6265 RepID=A0A0B2VUA9_TOXCA|nr:hypothetical protein Tcan_16139 [Toxocara canis]